MDQLPDPMLPVGEIVRRCPAKQLMALYKAPAFADADGLLLHVAQSRGKLKKGGTADLQVRRAARRRLSLPVLPRGRPRRSSRAFEQPACAPRGAGRRAHDRPGLERRPHPVLHATAQAQQRGGWLNGACGDLGQGVQR